METYNPKTAGQVVNQIVAAYTIHLIEVSQLKQNTSEQHYRERLQSLGLSDAYVETVLHYARVSALMLVKRGA